MTNIFLTQKSTIMIINNNTVLHWLFAGDQEMQEYVFKAYLQKMDQKFKNWELHPTLRSLKNLSQDLTKIQDGIAQIRENNMYLEKIILSQPTLIKKCKIPQSELEDIVSSSLKEVKKVETNGMEAYQNIYNTIKLEQIGLSSPEPYGIFLIKPNIYRRELLGFSYNLNGIVNRHPIAFKYVGKWEYTSYSTFVAIKKEAGTYNLFLCETPNNIYPIQTLVVTSVRKLSNFFTTSSA